MKGITLVCCMSKFEAEETHNGRIDGKKRVHGLWTGGSYIFSATKTIPDDIPLSSIQKGFFLPYTAETTEASA